jgi:hypothetical protein
LLLKVGMIEAISYDKTTMKFAILMTLHKRFLCSMWCCWIFKIKLILINHDTVLLSKHNINLDNNIIQVSMFIRQYEHCLLNNVHSIFTINRLYLKKLCFLLIQNKQILIQWRFVMRLQQFFFSTISSSLALSTTFLRDFVHWSLKSLKVNQEG